MSIWIHRATVRFHGRFPYDMLRYDCCYPATERDSALMEREDASTREADVKKRGLDRYDGFTPDRWESFNCQIVTVHPTERR